MVMGPGIEHLYLSTAQAYWHFRKGLKTKEILQSSLQVLHDKDMSIDQNLSVIVGGKSISNFQLLLQNHLAISNQTWPKTSTFKLICLQKRCHMIKNVYIAVRDKHFFQILLLKNCLANSNQVLHNASLKKKLSFWFVQMCNGKERKCRNNNSPQVGIEPGASRFKIQQSTKWAKEISHWRSASSSTDKPQPLQNEWLPLLQRKTVTKDENSKKYLKFQCFFLIDWLPSLIYWVKDSFLMRQGSQSISWTTVRDNSWRTWHRAFFEGGSSKLFKWMAHSSVRGDNISLKYVKYMGHFKNNISILLKWRVTSLCKRIYFDVQIFYAHKYLFTS